jgi:hypothetical protein
LPLAPYTEPFWFPDGLPASGQKLYVYPRNGPPLAQLFTDVTGTVPVPNPVTLPASGVASFFVTNGDYWGYINGQAFYLVIDLDPELSRVWPATFVHDHTVPETVWTIAHGLGSKPGVTVLGTDDQITQGDVDYVDDDTLTITFGAPLAGRAYLRR